MIRVGIVTALDFEARALVDASRFTVHRCGMSGAGADLAVRGLAEQGCGVVVSWGTAGALAPQLKSGDIYLPDRVLTRDNEQVLTDTGWRERFAGAARNVCTLGVGMLLDSPRIVAEPADKSRLHRSTGAGAVDMESGPVAKACAERALPFLVVRSIIDEARDRLPMFAAMHAAAANPMRRRILLAGLVLQPGEWTNLVRLAWRYRSVKASLNNAARVLALCSENAS
jgi:adenosylhomocysteine nucleosidase